MRVLVIGGTGLLSTAVVKHLLARNADVTVFNRGKRTSSAHVKTLVGDRNDVEGFARAMSDQHFDVVIDMICFNPTQAAAAIQIFAGRCEQFIFCSSAATYGVKSSPSIFVDETFKQEPISGYAQAKLACEKLFLQAHADGYFKTTIIRPSHTYGPGEGLLDNLEFDSVVWDRIERGQPVLCAGDGLGLWVATHRDDLAKLFAYAALNPKTFGQAYNATGAQYLTWRDYYREVAGSLGCTARLIFMPAQWILAKDRKRFFLLEEISGFHNVYDSSKAAHDVPEFKCEIGLREGAFEVFADQRRRGVWKDSVADTEYAAMVEATKIFGVEPVEA